MDSADKQLPLYCTKQSPGSLYFLESFRDVGGRGTRQLANVHSHSPLLGLTQTKATLTAILVGPRQCQRWSEGPSAVLHIPAKAAATRYYNFQPAVMYIEEVRFYLVKIHHMPQ